MSFEADLQNFPKMRRERGMQLVATEAVRIDGREGNHLLATVRDRKLHTVHLTRDAKGKLQSDCSCMGPAFCEHAAAVIFTENLRGQPRTEQSVPATRGRRTPAPQPAPAPAPTQPPQGNWRQRLERVLDRMPDLDPDDDEPLLWFVLDADRARRHSRLRLSVQKKRIKRAPTADERAADRRVLALLQHVPRETPRGEGSSFAPDRDESELLMPLLLATQRLHARNLANTKQSELVLLRAEEGPITFHNEMRRTPEHVGMHGWFELAGERVAAERVRAVLDCGYVLFDDRLAKFDAGTSLPLVRELTCMGPIEAPAAEEGALVRTLLGLADHIPEVVPAVPTRPAPPPEAVLIVMAKNAQRDYIPAELRFDYGSRRSEYHASPILHPAEPDGTYLATDPAAETGLLDRCCQLAGQELQPTAVPGYFTIPHRHVSAVMTRVVHGGMRVLADSKPVSSPTSLRIRVTSGIDWFSVNGEIEFGGATLPLDAAIEALLRGEHFVAIGDGSFAMLPEEWLRTWGNALLLGEKTNDGVRMHSSQALLLDALLSIRTETRTTLDEKFTQLRARIASADHQAELPEPEGFTGTLRPYQRRGLGWLHFLRDTGLGGCLADDMGLGKTIQVLALLLTVHRERPGNPSLLVLPLSLLANWRREAARFTPELRVFDFHGADRWTRLETSGGFAAHDLVLTTYGTLRMDIARIDEQQAHFAYAVLDEAHAIENAQSQTSKAVRLLRADHRLAMTGTPVQNHLGELWALFEFLNPGLLGRSSAWKRLVSTGDARGNGLDLPLLHRALAPVMLRRTKEQVLPDLPEKQEQDLVCELEGTQKQTYEALRKTFREKFAAGASELRNEEQLLMLVALLRLRQAACHEGLLVDEHKSRGSAKLDALLPMLQEIAESGHKALVFSQFTEFLAILRSRLGALGIQHEYLDGKTKQRQDRVDRFQTDAKCPLFLISLKAGGVGLNLTAADYVFLLDPWWNPAVEAQAVDRAHRIGRQGKVTVYRLIARDTVEEKVLQLQKEKNQLVDAVLGADKSLLAKLTRKDIAALLA
jgi:superfamily II DNA or RNA helicase